MKRLDRKHISQKGLWIKDKYNGVLNNKHWVIKSLKRRANMRKSDYIKMMKETNKGMVEIQQKGNSLWEDFDKAWQTVKQLDQYYREVFQDNR